MIDKAKGPMEDELPPVRMIATDIDGTMIRSDGSLSPRVKDAMAAALDAGIPVVPATGRPHAIAHDVIEASGLEDFWVFANGAITRHLARDELVRGFWLDSDVVISLVEDLRTQMPGAGFAVEFEDDLAFEPSFSKVVPLPPKPQPSDDILEPIMEALARGAQIQKLLAFQTETDVDTLFNKVSEVVGGRATPCYSGLNFIELSRELVTKGMALDLLSADLGFDPSEVAVFGDNHNDLPMLEWAGRSYAMANATEDAKEAADEVIGTNDEDGLAIKIEELLERFT